MTERNFSKIVENIISKDPRYDAKAYSFVRSAVDFTVNLLNKPKTGPNRHISGVELLDSIRRYAIQEFGPIALTVLNIWGIKDTSDFGEIVFNLVDADVLGKTKEDKKEDFTNVYNFIDAFSKPFLPQKPLDKKPSAKAQGESPSRAKLIQNKTIPRKRGLAKNKKNKNGVS